MVERTAAGDIADQTQDANGRPGNSAEQRTAMQCAISIVNKPVATIAEGTEPIVTSRGNQGRLTAYTGLATVSSDELTTGLGTRTSVLMDAALGLRYNSSTLYEKNTLVEATRTKEVLATAPTDDRARAVLLTVLRKAREAGKVARVRKTVGGGTGDVQLWDLWTAQSMAARPCISRCDSRRRKIGKFLSL